MKPSELTDFLTFAIEHRKRVLMVGPPGVGKTSIFKQVCKSMGVENVIWHPAISDPTEPKGLPFLSKDGERAKFIPFENLWQLQQAKDTIAVLLDDFPQAPFSVQASFMSLLDKYSDNSKVVFITAGNRRQDFAGAQGMLEPIKSRHHTIINIEPDLDDYINYGIKTGLPPEIMAFLRFRPNLLCDFKPSRDLVNSPCPRTISSVGDWINSGLTTDTKLSETDAKILMSEENQKNITEKPIKKITNSFSFEVISGAVGEGWAYEFLAFERMRKTLPDLNVILENPTQQKIPDEPTVILALCSGLAAKVTPKNIKNALIFMSKVSEEFQVLFIKDALKYNRGIEDTEEFLKWIQKNKEIML